MFIEYNVGSAPTSRLSRYRASADAGSTLPFVIVDSGNQASNGSVNFAEVYSSMVEKAMARPAQASLAATWQREGEKVKFSVQVTNLSGLTLSEENEATVHAIVYEEADVQETGRFVHAAVSTDILSLKPDASETFTLATSALSDVNWNKLHFLVMVDYRPSGSSGAYDMLQATIAEPQTLTPLTVWINQSSGQPDPAEVAPISFDVQFSAPVTGFTGSDVSISGTAPGVKSAVVEGAGTTYQVHVTGMTGPGTVIASIQGGVAWDAFGKTNLASVSFDNEVTFTPPILKVQSILRTSQDPTMAEEVAFQVIFSEAVREVDLADFELSMTGGLSGANLLTVMGSGTLWTITASTGEGSGSLRLDVRDDAVIFDIEGNPMMDLPYTTGEVYHVRLQNFTDVPTSSMYWQWIERINFAEITDGCDTFAMRYCPDQTVTRAQMAIFIERGMNGSNYTPPNATGFVFTDVSNTSFAAAWIEKLSSDGITAGCEASPLKYCPDSSINRAQMAIFLLRAKYGDTYTPPPVGVSTGFFDVPITHWAAPWIKQLAAEGITSGCGAGNYCPFQPVTRAQMAVFIVRTFDLP
jgi:hypothetical protein